MSNYEGKLGEWLKYVQQQVEATGDKEDEKPGIQPEESNVEPENVIVRDRMGRFGNDEALDLDAGAVVADSSLLEDRTDVLNRKAGLFEESDVPNVEDYLPFLKDMNARSVESLPAIPEPDTVVDQQIVENASNELDLFLLSEGTGEPKPVIRSEEPVKQETGNREQETESREQRAENRVQEAPVEKPIVRKVVMPLPIEPMAGEVKDLWDKLPRHIQLLMGQSQKEVAQHSYKKFKEDRDELVARLLDPVLSLEETARVLNVCPTTVRRYTNRGSLKHIRTVGNQRRFRLSDVLGFLETQTSGVNTDRRAEISD